MLMHARQPGLDTASPTLVDPFGRAVSYLRLSVTDRCNLRCVYCMSEDMRFYARPDVLGTDALTRIARAFVARGVRKIRITGGEPLVRKDIMGLFEALSSELRTGRLAELTLTTNGTRLAQHADGLVRCGVRRVNVSLDTLDATRFAEITRGGRLADVLAGLDAAQAVGLQVKLNVVALQGSTLAEVHQLIAFAHGRGMDLSFIETMPLGDTGEDRSAQYLGLDVLRREIASRWTLSALSDDTGGPARYARVAETGGRIGFITPFTHNFCDSCNRVRVTATGELFTCLGHDNGVSLQAALDDDPQDRRLHAAIDHAIARKPQGHHFELASRGVPVQLVRHMSLTGG